MNHLTCPVDDCDFQGATANGLAVHFARIHPDQNIATHVDIAGSTIAHHTLDPDWRDQAACRSSSTEIFFPPDGSNIAARLAVAICRGCPVRHDCAAEHLTERHGIFGGLTERGRRQVRREARRHGWQPVERDTITDLLNTRGGYEVRRAARSSTPLAGISHGTRSSYERHGCRCDDCTDAARDAKARYTARKGAA